MTNIQIAEPMSTSDIIRTVESIRESIWLSEKLYFPVMKFVEIIIPIAFDPTFLVRVVESHKMPDKYAYYDPQKNQMVVRADVYDKACADDGRHRFTIAHEIGHYFLHRDGVKLARVNDGYILQAYRNPEWQANIFGSELLMPNKLIRGLSVEEIQCECGTSYQAAQIAYNKAKKSS